MKLTMNPTSNVVRRAFGIVVVVSAVAVMVPLSAFAETFTEGKQVPPTTEKLKAGDLSGSRNARPPGRC